MYRIERFGTITLPVFNNEYTLSPVPAQMSVVETTAGGYDNDGGGRNRQALPFAINYSGIISEDTDGLNRTRLDALRGAVGTRALLYRRAADNETVHTCTARLVSAPMTWPYTQRGWFEVDLNFMQLTPWRGAFHEPEWYLDTGVLLDDGHELDESVAVVWDTAVKQVATVNAGNLPVNDVTLTMTAGGTAITSILITVYDGTTGEIYAQLQWLGTLAAGKSLVIDSGAFSILNDGVSNYGNLALTASHKVDHWLQVRPGTQGLALVRFGGNASSTFYLNYRDGWA